ncbi:Zinc finger CCHC-type [Arabidopsis thaliana x Arabidopsis arenosa]|uniref:Zinc finger CCHC-type n=1 Tax=Arabidopsis thaliana x Arabidopsis arenosa TaxID=1240361 RepID=A0A8T2A8Q5_9BRAS|nr:Zinc finger CCHC-type [Arabidopsis thaliana x Arabidopsis arenosa]
MATALLFQSIHETLVLQVGEHDTSKKVWNAIKVRHLGAERVKEARLQTLMDEFDRLKMKDSENIDDFVGKLSEISSKSTALFIHIIASLEQVLDLNTTGFEDIVGRLKVYEERVFEEEDSQEEQSKLMYANTENQSYQENRDYNGDFRGRGRGGRFNNRGRGRGRFNGGRDLSKVTCYRCDKIGHFSSNCPDRLLRLQEAQENENDDTLGADELMVHEVVYLNEKKLHT